MSDLLSPILFVMRDESESFWCFVFLMERLGPNFNRDQSGMHSQLFALSKVFFLSLCGWVGGCVCVCVCVEARVCGGRALGSEGACTLEVLMVEIVS